MGSAAARPAPAVAARHGTAGRRASQVSPFTRRSMDVVALLMLAIRGRLREAGWLRSVDRRLPNELPIGCRRAARSTDRDRGRAVRITERTRRDGLLPWCRRL